tara:strand:+ start:326 stop:511 length:186 start_codon:yes stop_codon:yes gene_type:complete
MSEDLIEVVFLTPQEELFTGTLFEITVETYRRVLLYGTCGYRVLPPKRAQLQLVKDKHETL